MDRVARGTAVAAAIDERAQQALVSAEDYQISETDSGVWFVTERMPAVRSFTLGFWIATGSCTESEAEAGLSHLLEHMLFRGTDRYASHEIDEIFDEMGAELNAGTGKETTSVYARVLDRHLTRAFDVIADMVWRPSFGELDAEREVVLEEIAMYEDDPQDRVFDSLGAAVFGSHPLGRAILGSAAVVGGARREQLAGFHAARYGTQSVVIAAAGSVEHEQVVEWAERATPVERDSAAPVPVVQAPTLRRGSGSQRFTRKDTEQFHVCLGGPGIARDDERRFALRVLDGLLGGTSSSRLFQEVRERRGLAYAVYSFQNLYAGAGQVGLYVGTRPENLAEAMSVIAGELERVAQGPIAPAEIDRAKENLKGRVVLAMESTAARMDRLGSSLLAEMPILSIDEIIERIDDVDGELVGELASELYAPDALVAAGIGPDEGAFEHAVDAMRVSV
ncbi:MAG: M16 family metallopeptidase [Solirubrobacteraceae bacterium]